MRVTFLLPWVRLMPRLLSILVLLMSATALAQPPVVSQNAAELVEITDQCDFTEGPAVDEQGNVYFTDQPNDRIMKIATNGELSTFLQPAGRSNGMFFADDGKLITCADEKNEMWEIDLKTKQHRVLFSTHQGDRLNGPNDLWIHPSGTIFFTDPFYKRPWWDHKEEPQPNRGLYRVNRDGKSLQRIDAAFKQPNGIVGDVQRNRLYVADIGDSKTYRFDMAADGSLSPPILFCEQGSDGMTVDADGNVYLTGKGVTVFNKDGEKIRQIDVPAGWTANVCFGGADRKTLFITASKSVFTLAMPVAGVR